MQTIIDVHSNTVQDERYVNVSCESIEYTPINMAGIP